MTIRTVSQLPPQTSNLPNGTLFEVSVPGGQKYISKKLSVDTLLEQFNGTISSGIANEFGLMTGTKPLNVRGISADVHTLSVEDCELSGIKAYYDIPVIKTNLTCYNSASQGIQAYDPDDFIPNVMRVKDLIDDRACFIGDDYLIDGDPGGDEAPRFTTKSENFMYFRIDDNGVDSSKWIDPETRAEAGYVECPYSGFLTMFGWLADNGNVLAQDAWVGLYGQIYVTTKNGDRAQKWIPLSIQPWVIGARSSTRQYVSFNLPVKEGLRLKVKTGFRVNGSTAGMQDSSTKSFNLNEPNCFVGWISHAR